MEDHKDDKNYLRSEEVYILGAGFTKAFYPYSPLMIDDYQGKTLLEKFDRFPNASHILESEINRNNGLINIEYLMTRLEGLMPYDFNLSIDEELKILSTELKGIFINRVREAKEKGGNDGDLRAFAKYCIENKIHCITFNYDDIFDEAIWKIAGSSHYVGKPYWHPDGGYGFFCKPSFCTIGDINIKMDVQTAILLLKLHGSINWFPRRGYPKPYSVDAMMHHEKWSDYPPELDYENISWEKIQYHLEPQPFIVPPLLTKSAIIEQPILRLVWYLAYIILTSTSKVTFIGYSCPITDIAVKVLLAESLESLSATDIYIVNFEENPKRQTEMIKKYRDILGNIPKKNFNFDGALEWSKKLTPNIST